MLVFRQVWAVLMPFTIALVTVDVFPILILEIYINSWTTFPFSNGLGLTAILQVGMPVMLVPKQQMWLRLFQSLRVVTD